MQRRKIHTKALKKAKRRKMVECTLSLCSLQFLYVIYSANLRWRTNWNTIAKSSTNPIGITKQIICHFVFSR